MKHVEENKEEFKQQQKNEWYIESGNADSSKWLHFHLTKIFFKCKKKTIIF